MSDLNHTRITILEVSSRNARFLKDVNAKPRVIRYVFVAPEFRHAFESDAEICQLWSIEWHGVLRLVVGVCTLLCIILVR